MPDRHESQQNFVIAGTPAAGAGIWESEQNIDSIGAESFRPVNERIVGQVLSDNIEPSAQILEIGSGLGYLASLVPKQYQTHYVQTDRSKAYVAASREANPHTRSLQADALSLPVGPMSADRGEGPIDGVLAMDMFDILLPDLPTVAQELSRVLRVGGKVLHFHNRRPSMGRLSALFEDSGRLVFPFMDTDNRLRRFQLVLPEDFAEILPKLTDPDHAQAVSEHPHLLDNYWYDDRPKFETLAREISRQLEQVGVSQPFSTIMHQAAAHAMEQAGLVVEYTGTARAERQVSRKWASSFLDAIDLPPGERDKRYWNLFTKEANGPTFYGHDVLPSSQIVLGNQLSLMIAQKVS